MKSKKEYRKEVLLIIRRIIKHYHGNPTKWPKKKIFQTMFEEVNKL